MMNRQATTTKQPPPPLPTSTQQHRPTIEAKSSKGRTPEATTHSHNSSKNKASKGRATDYGGEEGASESTLWEKKVFMGKQKWLWWKEKRTGRKLWNCEQDWCRREQQEAETSTMEAAQSCMRRGFWLWRSRSTPLPSTLPSSPSPSSTTNL